MLKKKEFRKTVPSLNQDGGKLDIMTLSFLKNDR